MIEILINALPLWFCGLTIILAFLAFALLRKAVVVFPKWGWKDRTENHSTHTVSRPRAGGIVIAGLFFVSLLLILPWDQHLWGFLLGGILIVGVNFIDDKYRLPWWVRLIVEIIACLIVVAFGIQISVLTNPFTNEAWFLFLNNPWMTKAITIFWILLFVNMMNWVDGMDGLASGISLISSLTLGLLSLLPFVNQPTIAQAAFLLAVLLCVFLYFNFYPAKILLGDSGATFLGFTLAILAIFSSAKVASFFLVLGIPILDAFWVAGRRVFIDKKSPTQGDKKHLHHRLLNLGLTVPQICLLLYSIAALFGMVSLILQGARAKLAAIIVMCLFAIIFFTTIYLLERRKANKLK
jgi:UDP-GlcNAc:undecaprenyl-phosphate GlcNAc-1-phosphate transferase